MASDNNKPYYYIFHIEDTEWWQYTVRVTQSGIYSIQLSVAATADTGRVSVQINGKTAATSLRMINTGGDQSWQSLEIPNLRLTKGVNLIRVITEKAGFNFRSLGFKKQ
jgi:hypothetical protein